MKTPGGFERIPEEHYRAMVRIHLMRHGEKDEHGNLSADGKNEARKKGPELLHTNKTKAFTSDWKRVIDTADAVQEGVQGEKYTRRERLELSASILRAHDYSVPSNFFANVVQARLKKAHSAPEAEREQAIKQVEIQNMQEWLSYDDTLIDETTNSPKNVARAVAYHLLRQIDMAGKLDDGSNIDLLNVTHEFMIAAIIKYAVEKKGEDGQIISGEEIMKRKQSIEYLESLNIDITVDNSGKRQINLHIAGEPYILDMVKLGALAEEYRQIQKNI